MAGGLAQLRTAAEIAEGARDRACSRAASIRGRSCARSSPATASLRTPTRRRRRAARRACGAGLPVRRALRAGGGPAEERRLQQARDRREPEGARRRGRRPSSEALAGVEVDDVDAMVALWRRRFGTPPGERQGEGAAGALPAKPRLFAVGDLQAAEQPARRGRLGRLVAGPPRGAVRGARIARLATTAQSRVKSAALQRTPALRRSRAPQRDSPPP